MEDKSKVIFGNEIPGKDYRKAVRSKAKYAKKYGDDSAADYPARLVENAVLYGPLGVRDYNIPPP